MLLDQALELANELGVVRRVEVGLDPLFQRREAKLLEMSDMGLRERLEREVGERGAAPETQSLSQCSGPFGRVPASRGVDQSPEPIEVELIRLDVHPVPGRFGLEDLRSECLPKLRDEVLQRRDGGSRRLLTPERVDEPVDGHHAPGIEQQERENGALLQAAEQYGAGLLLHLQRSQDPKLRHVLFVTRFLSPG